MRNFSQLYKDIVSGDDYWFETALAIRVDSDHEYGTYSIVSESDIFSISTSIEMFHGYPTIGSAVAQEIEVKMIYPTWFTIPLMAEIRPRIRVCNATQQSGWYSMGVFYVDTRERTVSDTGEKILVLHGYDAMLKAEQMYDGSLSGITGTSTDRQMVNSIAVQMGISVDNRTFNIMNRYYEIPLPTGYTCREVLGYIASMYAGCFIINDVGQLRLVSLTELPPETNLLITQDGDLIQFGDDFILV